MNTAWAQGVLLLLAAVVSGCISTTSGGSFSEPSPQKALEYRVSLARSYIGEGNWDDAKRNLRIARDINPNAAEVHEAFALVYQSTGELELAEESFKATLRSDRGLSRARNNYAAFLFQQGRYKEAVDQLDIVVRDSLYEARPQAYINLGLARLQLNDRRGAEDAFRRALSMRPGESLPLLELAELMYQQDAYSQATSYYQEYRSSVRQQTSRGLWLGIRLARATEDRNAEASYSLALRNLYPQSAEYAAYQKLNAND
jgi:type IV pilus assembly protein PilF